MTDWMERAYQLAVKAGDAGEIPVGAVIVDSAGTLIASAHNAVEIGRDVTAHAEMLALKEAREKTEHKFLDGYDLYVTLEPCPMCAAAISLSRIRRLYFGAYDPKSGGVEHGPRIYQHPTCHHRPEVYGGMKEAECGALLSQFFQARRG